MVAAHQPRRHVDISINPNTAGIVVAGGEQYHSDHEADAGASLRLLGGQPEILGCHEVAH